MYKFYKFFSRTIPDKYFPYLIRKTRSKFKKDIEKAKKDEKSVVESLLQHELIMISDDWDEIKADKMIKMARKYDLIIPTKTNEQNNVYWDIAYYGGNYLNSKGRAFIKQQLREELKFKRDRIMMIGTILLGIIGSLTGLLSIIIKN